jgi:hypothetical protein
MSPTDKPDPNQPTHPPSRTPAPVNRPDLLTGPHYPPIPNPDSSPRASQAAAVIRGGVRTAARISDGSCAELSNGMPCSPPLPSASPFRLPAPSSGGSSESALGRLQWCVTGKGQPWSRRGLTDAPRAHKGEHPRPALLCSGASMDVLGFWFLAGFFFKSGWRWHSDHLVMNISSKTGATTWNLGEPRAPPHTFHPSQFFQFLLSVQFVLSLECL